MKVLKGWKVAALLMAVFVMSSAPAQAFQFGPKAGFVLPFGDLADIANFGFQIGGFFDYPLTDMLDIRGDVGYHRFGGEDFGGESEFKISGAFIPIRGGVIYHLGESFVVGGLVGLYIGASDFEGSELGFAPTAGYRFQAGSMGLEASAELNIVLTEGSSSTYLGVGVSAFLGGND